MIDNHATSAAEILGGRRGVVLADVDGPLYPWDNKGCRRPEGFSSYRLTSDGRWYTGGDFRRHKGLRVWLNPKHGAQILAAAGDADLQPVWASTWLDDANRHIAPTLGLPELPTITYPPADLVPHDDGWKWLKSGGWKWPAVGAFAGDVPLAWWDDDFDDPRFVEAKERFLAARAGIPTLLCHVSPKTGLLDEHFDRVREWAADLPARDNAGPAPEKKAG